MTIRIFIGRPLPGTVGETKRVAHIIGAPKDAPMPGRFTTYCGTEFDPEELELLDRPSGMPCESCLRYAPLPSAEEIRVHRQREIEGG